MGVGEIAKVWVTVGLNAAEAMTGLAGVRGTLNSVAMGAGVAGAAMTAGFTVPAVRGAMAAKDAAAEYERKMDILHTMTGTSVEDFAKIDAATRVAGRSQNTYGTTAIEAAEGVTELVRSGMTMTEIFGDVNQVLSDGEVTTGALRAAIDLATNSTLSNAAAAEFMATALYTFKNDNLEAADAVDILVKAANASVADVDDFVGSFKNAGPTIAIYGMTLEDTALQMALLSQHGIKGAEAGTALKRMYTNLQRETKSVKEAMGDLGLSLYDTNGNMKDSRTIIDEFGKALFEPIELTEAFGGLTKEQQADFDKYGTAIENATLKLEEYERGAVGASLSEEARAERMDALRNKIAMYEEKQAELSESTRQQVGETRALTEEERNHYIQIMAGVYGMKSMNALLIEGTEGYDAMAGKIAEQAGAQELSAAKMEGALGAEERYAQAMQNLQLTVMLPLLDTFAGLIEKLTEGVRLFTNLDEGTRNVILAFVGVLAAIGPVLLIVAALAAGLSALLTPVGLVIAGLVALVAGFVAASGGLTPAIERLSEFGRAISERVMPFLQSLQMLWNAIWPSISTVVNQVLGDVVPFVMGMFKKMGEMVGRVMGKMSAFVRENFDLIRGTYEKVSSVLLGIWNFLWPRMEAVLNASWNTIVAIVEGAIDVVMNVIKAVMAAINGDWETAWTAMKDALLAVWNTIKTVVTTYFDMVLRFLGSSLDELKENWSRAWTDIKETLRDMWEKMRDKVKELFEEIRKKIEDKLTEIKTKWGDEWEAVRSYLQTKWEEMRDKVKELIEDIRAKIEAKVTEIKTSWETWWGEVKTTLETKWTEMVTAVKNKVQEIKDKIDEKATAIKDAVLKPFRDAKEALFGNGGVVVEIRDAVGTWMTNIKTKITELATGIKDAIIKPFKDALDHIFGSNGDGGIFGSALGWIRTFINSVKSIFGGNGANENMVIHPTFAPISSPPIDQFGALNGRSSGDSGGISTVNNITNYNLDAHYSQYSDEVSLRDQLTAMRMATA